MDKRYLYLHGKYRQEVAGCGPWPFINTLPDNELRADVAVAHALRMRPRRRQYPAGLI